MLPNINPRQMEQAMRKLGIRQEEIDAEEVIIRTADKDIIISEPSIQKVNMGGQVSYQISGVTTERSKQAEISTEDIATVAEQAHISEADAKALLEKHEGDLAAAILEGTEKR